MSKRVATGCRDRKGRKWLALQRNGAETRDSDGQWAAPTPEPKTLSVCRRSVRYRSSIFFSFFPLLFFFFLFSLLFFIRSNEDKACNRP